MKKYGYIRVSSVDQNEARQRESMRATEVLTKKQCSFKTAALCAHLQYIGDDSHGKHYDDLRACWHAVRSSDEKQELREAALASVTVPLAVPLTNIVGLSLSGDIRSLLHISLCFTPFVIPVCQIFQQAPLR